MEKVLKIDNDCSNNVENVQISEETKVLLLCRARLSDIYNNISEVVYHRYSADTEEEFPGFWDAFSKFDDELMKIISSFVLVTSVESNYKEI